MDKGFVDPVQAEDYADLRESRRVFQIPVMSAFVLVLGAMIGASLAAPLRWVVWGLAVLVIAFFAVAMLRRVTPATLTKVTRRVQPGVWPASIRAGEFPSLVAERGMNPDNVLLGRVEFTASAVVWTPTSTTAKSFHITSKHWDDEWSIWAKRLRGLGNQVRIDLVLDPGPTTTTLWMRRGGTYDIR